MGQYEDSKSYAHKTLGIDPVHSCETHLLKPSLRPGMITGAPI